jgi:phage terminase large subunit
MELTIPTAEFAQPLLQPARYKGLYGGRGSGKSHTFASLMVEDHLYHRGLRSVCIREVQKSLKDSAKLLLEDKIKSFGLGQRQGFRIFKELIQTPGDGQIVFTGMNDQNAESIKSLENFNRAWIEEAQTMSTRSLQLLTPTIRAPGSELWFSWNPRRKTDPVDKMLRGESLPSNNVVVRANWNNNPWFPAELEQERVDCMRINPDQYEHIWNGDYVTISESAYYSKHLTQAKAEGRLGRVAQDPLMTIRSFWDIGGTGARADACSIWIAQFIGKEIRLLDYYEAVGQPLSTHIHWLRDNGYGKAQIVLPHDGINHEKIYTVTYESALIEAGFDVFIVKNQGSGAAKQRVEAARRLFLSMWFNADKCQGGIDALGWYHEKMDEARGIGLGPDHDWSSHCADAFGLMAVAHPLLMDNPQFHSKIDYSATNKTIV